MEVIVLNGPMGVGKTTVGNCIANMVPGTALIDGDWCMDLHPFVGNQETKAVAIDNILHMAGNYAKCSVCQKIVLVWLMDEEWVMRAIVDGLRKMDLGVKYATLICDRNALVNRWNSDQICSWRTPEWLEVSLRSLKHFGKMDCLLETTSLKPEEVANLILYR